MREQFIAGRQRKFGQSNPELVHDPFLAYMVRTRLEPHAMRRQFDWPAELYGSSHETLAIWSLYRKGMTVTLYRDRYVVSIGGRENYNDEDALIYNDVIAQDFAGGVWIYRYPKQAFPPTDFHTATLLTSKTGSPSLGEGLLIVGGLGYPEDREFWRTPVYWLDLEEMWIQELETSGDEPGWIYGHETTLLSDGKLWVKGGNVVDVNGRTHPNLQEHEFDLTTRKWTDASSLRRSFP